MSYGFSSIRFLDWFEDYISKGLYIMTLTPPNVDFHRRRLRPLIPNRKRKPFLDAVNRTGVEYSTTKADGIFERFVPWIPGLLRRNMMG